MFNKRYAICVVTDGHNTTRLQSIIEGFEKEWDEMIVALDGNDKYQLVGIYTTYTPIIRTSDEKQRAQEILQEICK